MAQPIERFKILKFEDQNRLTFDGVELPNVEGQVLEGQFELADGSFLIILTEDCPFEETMNVYLFGPELEPLDRLIYGSIYDSFLITKCISEQNSEIQIYTDQTQLTLVALDQARSLAASLSAKMSGAIAGENSRLWLSAVQNL